FSNTTSSALTQYAAREFSDPSIAPLLVLKNLKPLITGIPDQSSSVGAAASSQWFGIWDAETAASSLTLSAGSSNTTLLPNANITFGGSGTDRTFTLTPAAGQSGMTTVTITVSDAQ